ncbi:MAG TPA: 23S rRNA (adenine(2503)-C(2))-methyltransferase RlmN [Candidatus Cloacimonadota bacterium]|nr:23S rRNA (adenine(2503)-C(2))-methyltransferase RlmN [Candidatus Cloacimonadota bacterium]
MLNSLYGIRPSDLSALIIKDFPAFRTKQLLSWVYQKMVFDPDHMSNLPKPFKAWLNEAFDLSMPEIVDRQISRDGSIKLLLKLKDGLEVEAVLISEGKKRTLCVSSQTGCARACAFCATGTLGPGRNLLPHEIVQQVLLASQILIQQNASDGSESEAPDGTDHLTNIVFMGMGEPLDNFDNVMEALRIIQDPAGLAFSPRRITVSTCGIVPGIIRLADMGVKVKLALSLNSAVDSIRDKLMPVNRLYPLPQLKTALQYFKGKNPFRITFEYILIPGVNMDETAIKALRRFTGDLASKINFIPFNPVPQLGYRAPTKAEVESFMAAAASLPQAITLRKSKGQDINGACGQLALNHLSTKQVEKVERVKKAER